MVSSHKSAVITGTSGIALGIAKRLLRDGFAVILCGNDTEQNAAARTELAGKDADVVDLDVSDADAVERFAADLGSRLDGLDALVNCAAIQPYGTVETTTPADWNKVIGINLTGYYLMAHFLYPLLKKRGQRIDRQLRLGPGPHEPEQRPRLRHVEGRDPCPHPGDGGRLRQGRDPRQLDLPGLDHVADAGVFRPVAHAGGRGLGGDARRFRPGPFRRPGGHD